MPRVARRKDANAANSPFRSPKSIPLNDDKNEKAARLQSRQALHEIHLNQIRAAASPNHRKIQYDRVNSPTGQDKDAQSNGATDQAWLSGVSSLTASKRVPILANFEEWMRMATDNKINATNSWNFALIDYFHDMSLLKEGDSVNFQRASCTLDGCVKIYTSRVDSVATETGKLLSGLANSGNKESTSINTGGSNEDDDIEGDDDDGEGGPRRRNKKKVRSSEATLALSFAQIQLKKFELEFSVDPLFKKASADFDEGGAKGLLLNHLCMDSNGRIIFDSSDEANDSLLIPNETTADVSENSHANSTAKLSRPSIDNADSDIELESLKAKFLFNLNMIDEQHICPSLKELDIGVTMDMASLSGLYNHNHKRKDQAPGSLDTEKSDLDLIGLGNDQLDSVAEPDFGSGGDVWASEAGLEPLTGGILSKDRLTLSEEEKDNHNSIVDEENVFGVRMQFGVKKTGHQDILGYFDATLQGNWAGPEHWRIKRMKQEAIPREAIRRKEKEPFEINFYSPLARKITEQIHTSATTNVAISMPKSQWRSRTRYLLPDDKHFSSTQLLRLYLKPKARLGRRTGRRSVFDSLGDPRGSEFIENSFWAREQAGHTSDTKENYNADFFREDATIFPNETMDEDGDEFADAREIFSPPFEHQGQSNGLSMFGTENHNEVDMGYGSSLVTKPRRLRPEYVTYAKVAKRVDVRLLKEKIWDGLGFEVLSLGMTSTRNEVPAAQLPNENQKQSFTAVLNGLQDTYPPEAMAEISTSYCFISLLHLANEKGLRLSNEQGLEELSIQRDAPNVVSVAA